MNEKHAHLQGIDKYKEGRTVEEHRPALAVMSHLGKTAAFYFRGLCLQKQEYPVDKIFSVENLK